MRTGGRGGGGDSWETGKKQTQSQEKQSNGWADAEWSNGGWDGEWSSVDLRAKGGLGNNNIIGKLCTTNKA